MLRHLRYIVFDNLIAKFLLLEVEYTDFEEALYFFLCTQVLYYQGEVSYVWCVIKGTSTKEQHHFHSIN